MSEGKEPAPPKTIPGEDELLSSLGTIPEDMKPVAERMIKKQIMNLELFRKDAIVAKKYDEVERLTGEIGKWQKELEK